MSSSQTGPGGQNHRGLLQDTTPSFPPTTQPLVQPGCSINSRSLLSQARGKLLNQVQIADSGLGKRGRRLAQRAWHGCGAVPGTCCHQAHILAGGSDRKTIQSSDYLLLPAAIPPAAQTCCVTLSLQVLSVNSWKKKKVSLMVNILSRERMLWQDVTLGDQPKRCICFGFLLCLSEQIFSPALWSAPLVNTHCPHRAMPVAPLLPHCQTWTLRSRHRQVIN